MLELPNATAEGGIETLVAAGWIGEKLDGALHVQPRTEFRGKAVHRIDGDVVEAVQFVDHHDLDQLVDAQRPRRRRVGVGLVGFLNRVAAEQHVEGRRLADAIVDIRRRKTFGGQCALKAGARNAIERQIEHEQAVVDQDVRDGGKMAVAQARTDPEIAFRLDAEHPGRDELLGAEENIHLETFDVHLEEVGVRDHALAQQRVEAADLHLAQLLAALHIEPARALAVHRACGRVRGIDVERTLFIELAGRKGMVMPVPAPRVLPAQLHDGLFEGVEPVNHQVVAEQVPVLMLAALNADIDENERLLEKARRRDPFRELGAFIEVQIHYVVPTLTVSDADPISDGMPRFQPRLAVLKGARMYTTGGPARGTCSGAGPLERPA